MSGYEHEITVAVPRRGDGKYLILKRAQHKVSPGKWTFPGGSVEEGESAEEAALRELREEAGLQGEIVDSTEPYDREVRGELHLAQFFLVEVSGEVELDDEHQDYEWIEISEIDNYETVGNHTGIRKLGLVESG